MLLPVHQMWTSESRAPQIVLVFKQSKNQLNLQLNWLAEVSSCEVVILVSCVLCINSGKHIVCAILDVYILSCSLSAVSINGYSCVNLREPATVCSFNPVQN